MGAILFTATGEHDCHYRHCYHGGTIKVGERAIKTQSRTSTCGYTYLYTVYYHEDCYQTKGGKRK